jgi:hypothetical protein
MLANPQPCSLAILAADERDARARPAQLADLQVATGNLLNLALPGRNFYARQDGYDDAEYERKVAWLGAQLARLNADVMGCQEVWDQAALQAAVARSGLRYAAVLAPGAEQGAVGTPRVGLITRLSVEAVDSVADFTPADHVQVPEIGAYTRFERPVLHARLRTAKARRCTCWWCT